MSCIVTSVAFIIDFKLIILCLYTYTELNAHVIVTVFACDLNAWTCLKLFPCISLALSECMKSSLFNHRY